LCDALQVLAKALFLAQSRMLLQPLQLRRRILKQMPWAMVSTCKLDVNKIEKY